MKLGVGLDSPGKAVKLSKSVCSRITWDQGCSREDVGKKNCSVNQGDGTKVRSTYRPNAFAVAKLIVPAQ